jgi:hypothetical protein
MKVTTGIQYTVFRSKKTLHLVKNDRQLATNDIQKVCQLASKFNIWRDLKLRVTVTVEKYGNNHYKANPWPTIMLVLMMLPKIDPAECLAPASEVAEGHTLPF